jgi:putative ABC transport system permease protein
MARDFRAGELRLLVVAVMLAVAALAAVGFFADRINAGLARDARQILGGDAIVASDQPAPAVFAERARDLGLTTATTAVFPSMGRAPDGKGGASRLVTVKAVSAGYPLRGQLRINAGPGTPDVSFAGAPELGNAWVDPPLLDALGLQVGDMLMLGDSSLRIAKTIIIEPDRGAGFLSFAPRVLMNEADLAATGLIQPASRVTYRLAVAAKSGTGDAAVGRWVQWAETQVKAGALRGLRIESLANGRPEMRQTLDRAEKFLNLVALLAALLAAVAVGIASRDFASRHLDDCAMLRVLGLPQRTIALQYLIEFSLIGLLASVAGVAIGFAVHHVFIWLLAGIVRAELPPPSLWPALFGVGVGFTLLMGFGLPPVLQLAKVPPLRVIRRDVGALKPASLAVLAAGAAGFIALLLAVSSDIKLGAIAVGGFAAAVALFAVLSWLAVQLLKRAVPEARAPRWLVLATRQIAARPAFAVLQVSALSVGLLALVLLVLLRTDLIDSWRQATPKDAPNRFVINVQPIRRKRSAPA